MAGVFDKSPFAFAGQLDLSCRKAICRVRVSLATTTI